MHTEHPTLVLPPRPGDKGTTLKAYMGGRRRFVSISQVGPRGGYTGLSIEREDLPAVIAFLQAQLEGNCYE